MGNQDFFVAEDGNLQICQPIRAWNLLREDYRLYRFLTEVEDILKRENDENSILSQVRTLVRQLIINSYWVQTQYPEPCYKTGTSVKLLYEELGFPLTVQTVTFSPGTVSTIHNHGTWGIVGVLKGREKNTFWRRSKDQEDKTKIEFVGEQILEHGDIISLTSEAIHCVEAVGDEPTVTFNLYGETDPLRRFEFDPVAQTARKF